jgi:putative ABC transport system substrate-binding protein
MQVLWHSRTTTYSLGELRAGPDLGASFHEPPLFIDKILRGTPPRDLPIQRPPRFDLAINLKTAKALGLMIPSSLLARVDQVIDP